MMTLVMSVCLTAGSLIIPFDSLIFVNIYLCIYVCCCRGFCSVAVAVAVAAAVCESVAAGDRPADRAIERVVFNSEPDACCRRRYTRVTAAAGSAETGRLGLAWLDRRD